MDYMILIYLDIKLLFAFIVSSHSISSKLQHMRSLH